MNRRKLFIIIVTTILISSLLIGAVSALSNTAASNSTVDTINRVSALSNIRDYTSAPASASTTAMENGIGTNYAVDAGRLYRGGPANWVEIETPEGIIINSVAVSTVDSDIVYFGAANEMALYRSVDAGQNWERYLLSEEAIGAVTDVAVDSFQKIVYVATDTAGLFRLRDVGSSMTVSSRLLVDEPILEVVADSTGSGIALARTEWTLYRAENFGLSWVTVDNLLSVPTALAIANQESAIAYVGTVDRGLLMSEDGGLSWRPSNAGLGVTPGSRLQIDALAVDVAQPTVLYVASSFLYGSTSVHTAPMGVSISTDGARAWNRLDMDATESLAVAALLPVSGEAGSVYALTTQSRTPLALGNAPIIKAEIVASDVALSGSIASTSVASESSVQANGWSNIGSFIAWIIAGLAALALLLAAGVDFYNNHRNGGASRGDSSMHHRKGHATLAPSF